MKIVIDLPENVIEDAKSSPNYYPIYYFVKIWHAIANGKPYEEISQGDLISREALKEALHNEIGNHALSVAIDRVIDNAPTVVNEYTK